MSAHDMPVRSILAASIDIRAAVMDYAIANSHMRSPFEDSFNSLEVNLLIDQLAAFHPEVCEEITDRLNRWTAQGIERDEGLVATEAPEPGQVVTNPTGDIGRRMIDAWNKAARPSPDGSAR